MFTNHKMYFLIYSETEEQEIKVLTKLKETVDKQREELRQLKRDHTQKNVDCDAVSSCYTLFNS